MSTSTNDAGQLQRAFTQSIRAHWKLFLVEGIILVLLGLLAIVIPPLATLGVTIVLGWVFLFSGVAGLITTFGARQAPGFWWSLLSAILAIAAGVVLLISPVRGAISLTFLLIAFFVIEGVITIMQQRVAIARSYAIEPEVLLMDEPFGSLDAQTRILMQEELIRISRVNPRTVLFITHAVEEALYLADRVVVLARNPGRIVEIMDTRPTREAEGWDKLASEETMEMPGFGHLRAQIWRLLRREMQAPSREKEKT